MRERPFPFWLAIGGGASVHFPFSLLKEERLSLLGPFSVSQQFSSSI